MYVDTLQLFSDAQALTVTVLATNVVDLSQDRSIGTGEDMGVFFQVDVAADLVTGDETYQFEVEYASNAGQTTGRQLMGRRIFQAGTPTAPNQNANLLVAGFIFNIPVPKTVLSESEQFIGVRYTLSGTTPTLTITSWMAPVSTGQSYTSYAKGYTIS